MQADYQSAQSYAGIIDTRKMATNGVLLVKSGRKAFITKNIRAFSFLAVRVCFVQFVQIKTCVTIIMFKKQGMDVCV